MKHLVYLVENIYNAMKAEGCDCKQVAEDIDMAILDLLQSFCQEELNLTGYYGVDIEEDHPYYGGWFQTQFGNRIAITDRCTRYTKAIIEQHYNLLRDNIRTMLHEFRHAWQFNGGMEWPTEYTNGSNGDVLEYLDQPIEEDARDWARENDDLACQYVAERLINKILE